MTSMFGYLSLIIIVQWGHFCSQEIPPTPGQPVKEPMFIPVAVGLLDSTGKDIPLSTVYHDGTLQSVSSNGQSGCTTILRVTKVVWNFSFDIFFLTRLLRWFYLLCLASFSIIYHNMWIIRDCNFHPYSSPREKKVSFGS